MLISQTTNGVTSESTDGHHIVTRSKSKQALIAANCAAKTEPKTIEQAVKLPHWYAAMKEEVDVKSNMDLGA